MLGTSTTRRSFSTRSVANLVSAIPGSVAQLVRSVELCIVAGPSSAPDMALRAAKMFFLKHGLPPEGVTVSEVPFRSW